LNPFTSSVGSIIKETKRDICPNRDTFAFCLLFPWRESCRFHGFDKKFLICSARWVVVCTRTTSGAHCRNALNSNKLRSERTAEFQSPKTPSFPRLTLSQILTLGETISSLSLRVRTSGGESGSFKPLWAGFRDHFDRSHLHIVVCLRYVLVLRRLHSGDGRAGDLDLVTDMGR